MNTTMQTPTLIRLRGEDDPTYGDGTAYTVLVDGIPIGVVSRFRNNADSGRPYYYPWRAVSIHEALRSRRDIVAMRSIVSDHETRKAAVASLLASHLVRKEI